MPMVEEVLIRSPDQLRDVARVIGPGADADELDKIADRIEIDGHYTEIRPARQVTFRPPAPTR